MRAFRCAAATTLLTVLSGCSFSVNQVPPPVEFSKPVAEVVAEYPDMARVFKSDSGNAESGMARIEPFVATWGEPDTTQLSWWNLWPGNWLFIPQELWTWTLADKRIQCRVDHPIYEGFTATICNCQEVATQ